MQTSTVCKSNYSTTIYGNYRLVPKKLKHSTHDLKIANSTQTYVRSIQRNVSSNIKSNQSG